MAFGEVALADAVDTIRRELEQAISRGQGSSVAFEAGPVKMEFEVDFTATGGGEAGLKVWVVSVGARGEVQRSSVNRLTIELQPVDRTTRTKSLIGDDGTE